MTKLFKPFFITLSLIFLFFGSLPIIAQHILIQQLQKQGLTSRIEDVNLNLFSGKIQIINLQETGNNNGRLQIQNLFIDFDWLPLLDHSLAIKRIKLEGIKLSLQQDAKSIKVGKIVIPLSGDKKENTKQAKSNSSWSVSLSRLIIKNLFVHYQNQKINLPIHLNYLQLSHVNTAKIDQKNRLAIDLSLAHARIKSNILGDFLNPNAQIKAQLLLKNFDFSPYKKLLPTAIKLNKGSMQSDSFFRIRLLQYQPKSLIYRGSLQLDQLDLLYQDKHLSNQRLHWQGNSQLNWHHPRDIQIKYDGILNNQGLQLNNPALQQQLAVKQVRFKAQASLGTESFEQSIHLLADSTIRQLQLSSLDGKKQIAMEQLKVQSVELNTFEQLNIAQITLDNLYFKQTQKQPFIYHNRQLSIQKINLKQKKQLFIDKINQAAQTIRLKKDKKKQLNLQKFLQAFMPPAQEKQPTESNNDTTAFYYQIKQIYSEQPNTIDFVDQSVIPEFKQLIRLQKININNINNFDKQQTLSYQLEGHIAPDGEFKLEGNIRPFTDKLNLQNTLTAEGIALSGLTSYTLPASGYALESGEVDIKSRLSIIQNQVNAQNKLDLHQFTIAEADAKTAEALNNKLTLPLNKALDLLRDEQNNIHLNIPLKGNIKNLSVNPNDTINTALANALGTASKVYIATALFPYGTAYTLVKLANEKINAIQLDPVEFVPGKTKLGSKQKDYLNKLGSVLQKKKSLYIRLCAKASQSDKAMLIKQRDKNQDAKTDWKNVLLQLADKRKEVVKNYLYQQNKINKKRLVDCRSAIDKEKKAKGRVDLLM